MAGRMPGLTGVRHKAAPERSPAARWGRLRAALLVLGSLWLIACDGERSDGDAPSIPIPDFVIPAPIAPLPQALQLDPAKVQLGRTLFNDPRLSGNGSVACSSCHDIGSGGADPGRRFSVGVDGREMPVTTPTVLNSGFNFVQFWDGRALTLEVQVVEMIEHPVAMGGDLHRARDALGADAALESRFRQAYGERLTVDNLVDALATYLRALITPSAPFDRYLLGDPGAVGADVLAGFELFTDFGCVACHQGRNVGGNMFQRFGVMGDYFADAGDRGEPDYGRYNVTGRERDRHVFKVPTLRNVARTAPYFHDGSAASLEEAVEIMVRYQLGRPASAEQVAGIVTFLESLSGELDESLL